MDDRFLHEGERLLCSLRSTPAALFRSSLRGVLDALILGAAADIVIIGMAFAMNASLSPWLYACPPLIAFTVALALRFRVWKHSTFRVTTERILLSEPNHFLHAPIHTVKWSQYQESYPGHRKAFDIFFLSRPLIVRHGTADARLEHEFPSLYYAHDLKHYLDKVDSCVRKGETESLKPFVAKPRGKRDA